MEKRKIAHDVKQELKDTFTAHWQYMALRTACQLNLFDEIDGGCNTIEKLAEKTTANLKAVGTLVEALIDADTIVLQNAKLTTTPKGKLLTAQHPDSMKEACILWGGEHLTAWQELCYTIETGKPAFDKIFKTGYFDYIATKPPKLTNYQKAMSEYARDDYKNITEIIDFSVFSSIADVGGSTGTLIKIIAHRFPEKKCILTDLPEVIAQAGESPANVEILGENFFEAFSFKTDAIILSRILHDWCDAKAGLILANCAKALHAQSRIFIIEILQEEVRANLLTLNMMLMTQSFERTYDEYNALLAKVNFEIKTRVQLNELQTILMAERI